MKVLFLPEVSRQFVELVDILYEKGYLSYLEMAIDYSESLFRDIQFTLPIKVHKKAPSCLTPHSRRTSTRHGMFSSTSI